MLTVVQVDGPSENTMHDSVSEPGTSGSVFPVPKTNLDVLLLVKKTAVNKTGVCTMAPRADVSRGVSRLSRHMPECHKIEDSSSW